MSESKSPRPDPVLINRLHEACMPWLKHRDRSAFNLAQGEGAAMDHVLESPENVLELDTPAPTGDYAPEKA